MAYVLDHYTELTEMLAISKRLVEFYDAAKIDLSDLHSTNLTLHGNLLTD